MPRPLLTLALTLALAVPAFAADPAAPKPSADADLYAKLAEAGNGVYKVDTDKDGRITSCIVVGQSRISTTLGVAKGKEVARTRAELEAKGAFAKWLNEKVDVHQKSESETILFVEGAEGNNLEALKESGKSVEKTATKIESVASGLVRGFKLVHVEVKGDDKTYSIVYRWDAKVADAVKDLTTPPAKDPPVEKPIDKKIGDKKITID